MRTLRIVVMFFALTAILPVRVFAQNAEKIRCKTTDCVFEYLKKLDSKNGNEAAEAEKVIAGLAEEARNTGDSESKDALRDAILPYVEKFSNGTNVDFLLSLIPQFCDANDDAKILQLVENELLADKVIRVVGEIPGSDLFIEKYIVRNHDDLKYKAALAYAVGKLDIKSMENELVSWLKDADDNTKIEIYKALVIVKSNKKTASIIEKGAKKLYKTGVVGNQTAALQIMTALKGEKALPMLYKALKNTNGQVRREALAQMKPFVNVKVVKNVMKKCNKGEALVDAINWLGEIKDHSQIPFLIKQLDSERAAVACASIRAIFIIDDPDGINAVKPLFGGKYQDVITESLVTYEGDYKAFMNDFFKGDDVQKLAALKIIESRPSPVLFLRVKDLLNDANMDVRNKAYKSLKLVVSQPNGKILKDLLEVCDDKYVEDVQLAIKAAMADAPTAVKDDFASTLKHVKPAVMPRYYKVFAYFGTELCIDKLIDAYKNGDYKADAEEALLLVDNEAFKDKIKKALK